MKKKNLLLVLVLFMMQSINAKEYSILDYGAVAGKLSTTAIQKAIDVAFDAGGGTVIVPAGVYITGAIILKSRINLHLEQGAELRSSTNLEDFKIGARRYGMIFCEDAIGVSITGQGMINALGMQFYEADKNHGTSSSLNGVKEFDRMATRQKEGYLPEGKFFTDGPIKRKPRPGMTIVFFHCNDVTIKDITVYDTPVWAIRFGYCEGVVVTGVSIFNSLLIPNSDGIHMTVSRNVRISDCEIQAGDDAIIVQGFTKAEDKPGFTSAEQDSHHYGNKSIYAENIQVTNCHLQSRSSGIRIGFGQHPIRRIIFNNIIISESNRGIGIYARDSASIEELIFSNIIIETRLHNGIWWGHGEPIHISAISRFKDRPVGKIKDVQFNNITATGEEGIVLYGSKENPMENIRFNNVKLYLKRGKETMDYGGNFDLRPTTSPETQIFKHDIPGIYAQNIDQLSIRDLDIKWDKDLPAFFTNGVQCLEVKDLLLEGFSGSGNPASPGSKSVLLERTTKRKLVADK